MAKLNHTYFKRIETNLAHFSKLVHMNISQITCAPTVKAPCILYFNKVWTIFTNPYFNPIGQLTSKYYSIVYWNGLQVNFKLTFVTFCELTFVTFCKLRFVTFCELTFVTFFEL
uniref:Uncharacterized protein n=1 Tax=Cacopsylla melanoneura TaxID=428564 RepID=A0A8D8TG05_9HEMI